MPATTVFSHPILRVETFPVQGRDRLHRFVRLRVPDWVNCVALTSTGEVILVEQHRHGIGQATLEVPGGAVDPDESPAQAALRELSEETGYGGGRVEPLGWIWSNPAIQDNRTWLFAALGVARIREPDPDPTESITVSARPGAEIPHLLNTGAIAHAYAVVALQRAMLRGLLPIG